MSSIGMTIISTIPNEVLVLRATYSSPPATIHKCGRTVSRIQRNVFSNCEPVRSLLNCGCMHCKWFSVGTSLNRRNRHCHCCVLCAFEVTAIVASVLPHVSGTTTRWLVGMSKGGSMTTAPKTSQLRLGVDGDGTTHLSRVVRLSYQNTPIKRESLRLVGGVVR